MFNFYTFVLDPVEKVTLASSNLKRSIAYWKDILEMKEYGRKDKSVLLGYADGQAKLELEDIGTNFLYKILLKGVFE